MRRIPWAVLVPVLLALLAVGAAAQGIAFTAPIVVKELSSFGSDYYPFISRDNLTFRVASSRTDVPGRKGGWDIYRATRITPHSTFGPLSVEPGGINGTTNDIGHHFMGDELTAYVANSQAGGAGGHDIYGFTRATPTASWSGPVRIGGLNSISHDYCVTVTDDHLEMYFSGSAVLKRSMRTSTTIKWGAPQAVPELNRPALPVNADMPSISGDGLTLYLVIRSAGLGDLYMTTRAHRSQSWTLPVRLTSVSSKSDDLRPSISPDGRQLFFTSSRATSAPGVSGHNVWMARFIGLTNQNLPQVGKPMLLHVTEPGSWGLSYQVALSLGNARGIPIPGVGTVPLDLDHLLIATTKGDLPGVFRDFAGVLDRNGEATARINIPNIKALIGIVFHAAAVTYDSAGIRYVTNGRTYTIHQ